MPMQGKVAKITVIILAVIAVSIALFIGLTCYEYNQEMTAAKKRLQSGSEILKTREGDIEYATRGEGRPVLLLHGAGGGYDQGLWTAKIALDKGYKLISVSRFGYLRTPLPENASIKRQAAMYRELLDHLKIDKVIVLGASAGGASAIQFASDYPKMTSALILMSAVSMGRSPDDQDTFIVDIIHLVQQSDYAYWLAVKYMPSIFLEFLGVPADVYNGFTSEQKVLAREMLDIMHPMSQRYPGTMNDGKMIDREGISSSSIAAPTLIIHAKDDALVSSSHADNSHRIIPQSRLVLFDTGGHAILSQVDKVRENVKQFLTDSVSQN